jgi:nitrite reductase/ring-hydroxylating ferredoxin subunit
MGPAKFKMGVSGCPRNCAEATIKDLGVVAADGGWDISIGGNGGASVVAAKHLVRVKTDDEVVRIADRFYEFYRRNARFGERSAPFVERLGFEAVAAAVLAGWPKDEAAHAGHVASGSAAEELEAGMAATLAAYRDPWREGRRPLGDFRDQLDEPEAQAEPASFSFASLVGRIPAPPPAERPAANTSSAGAASPSAASQGAGQGSTPANTRPGGAFKPVIRVDQLPPGRSKLVNVGGKRLAVFHGRDNSWLVTNEGCPHEGGPLVDGIYGNGRLTCTVHQYAYNTKTGACDQPNGGELKIYRHEIRDGMLMAMV